VSLSLLLLTPLLLLIALSIKSDGGSVLFRQKRVGYKGKLFTCYKFRTMVPNAEEVLHEYLRQHPEMEEEWNRNFKLKNDPRATIVGKVLRKTSLDEVPQLWNVLKGDMNFVGPRPILPQEQVRYGDDFFYYASVRPGITGIWQVGGRSNTTFEDRVCMDVQYVKKQSLALDCKILFKTIWVVFNGSGAS
ncbi:MAG: UDP-phosphate galactose phosphotransferase, partial [Deltaproteobacteria bacterium CG_4_10_14_0_2_um_filter_43_8]